MKFREIETSDLPALAVLLSEGFPTTTRKFWARALGLLEQRKPVEGLPRYGIALEAGGTLNGVLLMLNQRRGETTFSNLSSWYVREQHRGAAPFMFTRALAAEGVTYLDCSPVPAIVPVIERYGFQPYTGGALMLDARMSLRRGRRVTALTPEAVMSGALTSGALAEAGDLQADRIAENLSHGCQGLIARGADDRPVPLLYRVARVKRHIPIARFVYGAPEIIAAHAGSIAAHLLARGIPVAHVDWPAGIEPPVGRLLPRYGVRYKRGPGELPVGDLLDTEYAVFGI